MRTFRQLLGILLVLPLVASLALLSDCGVKMGDLMHGPKGKPAGQAEPKQRTFVLVVPAGQGPAVTAVTSGAQLAAAEQTKGGNPVAVRVLRAEGNWLQELAGMPDGTVVGGPMSESAYRQMKGAGILGRKVVFAFLPKIDAGDEGTVAWRFFPSLDDQIDAVVGFSADRLGLRSMASFGPSDSFANAATALLEQKLAERNVVLHRVTAGADVSEWPSIARGQVAASRDEDGALVPHTPFRAVFLPDSWKKLKSADAAFVSAGDEGVIMLGTMLWDGYRGLDIPDRSRYLLVAYPGAYLKERAPGSLAGSNFSSFWGALGYDFVRFACRLRLKGRPGPDEVTAAARQAASMNFSMAPVAYGSDGRARQRLYMLQPTPGGPREADPQAMLGARDAALESARDRSRPAPEPDVPVSEEGVEAPMPDEQEPPLVQRGVERSKPAPAAQPAAERQTIMHSSKPYSSYKLSLPGSR